jgi:hypothetical protein
MVLARHTGPHPGGYGGKTHHPHHPLNSLPIDPVDLSYQVITHLSRPIEGVSRIFFINQAHQLQIFLCLRCRSPIVAGPG